MPHYTVERDDSELRIAICPNCSTKKNPCSDITITKDVIPYCAEGHLLNLMQCNKCGVYFSFYTEDGVHEVTKAVATRALKKGDCDMDDDGHDQHCHSYYVIFKDKPPTLTHDEYYGLMGFRSKKFCDFIATMGRKKEIDGEYTEADEYFKKWEDDLPTITELIEYRDFLNNIDFEKMEANYLKPVKNRWFGNKTGVV